MQDRKIFLALCANAVVLVLVLFALLSRDSRVSIDSTAFAQMPAQQPVTAGNGLVVMPAQFSSNTWGCYLLDNENKTLCVYQYSPGEKLLRLTAARNIENDRRLENFNTLPAPLEVKDLVTQQNTPATQPQ